MDWVCLFVKDKDASPRRRLHCQLDGTRQAWCRLLGEGDGEPVPNFLPTRENPQTFLQKSCFSGSACLKHHHSVKF